MARLGVRWILSATITCLLLFPLAPAQTFTVLHKFKAAPDGAYPYSGVIADQAGNLYGVTSTGGRYGDGTIFKVEPSGKTVVLHAFTKHEGTGSYASLLMDKAGNFYGTNSQLGSGGVGTVFKLRPDGKLIVLHTFGADGVVDGWNPQASLIADDEGNFYGTTVNGGTYGQGAVYKVDDRTGAESLLYSFGNPPDGARPFGNLLLDSEGNLYGTTIGNNMTGGASTVFEISPQGVETILLNFNGGDGQYPAAGLIRDNQGNLYSTTSAGGTSGIGTVFELTLDGNIGNITVLHDFDGSGSTPYSGVVRDSAGNLYGTTWIGGNYNLGIVYKLDPSNNLTVLHNFSGSDGAGPWAGLIMDKAGNLYGTTVGGGDPICGCGVVFKLTP